MKTFKLISFIALATFGLLLFAGCPGGGGNGGDTGQNQIESVDPGEGTPPEAGLDTGGNGGSGSGGSGSGSGGTGGGGTGGGTGGGG